MTLCFRCERVYQHLEDPEGAARELARVLAPGGRAVVVDSDWGTSVQSMGDPDVVRRLNTFAWGLMANPFSGRLLRGQLHRAGLAVDPDIAATAVLMPDEVIRQLDLLRVPLELAVAEGEVSAEEAATSSRTWSRRSTRATRSFGDHVRRSGPPLRCSLAVRVMWIT